VHSIVCHAAIRRTSALRLKISLTIGLLTCFLAGTSSHSDAADGSWRERYSAYQTSTRQEKSAKTETELSGPLFAVVSIADQRISIYNSQGLVARSGISSGMRGHPTPTGFFSIVQKKRWHQSNIYSGAPMPFMQRITWSGIALHAGALPGYPASHGCIRLPSSFAQRLFGATEIGQRVVVAPRDTVPVELVHKTLPAPALLPAPAGTEVSADGGGTVTASIDTPQGADGASLEKVSISDAPQEARPLNPLELARVMKRDASEKARIAARATRTATLQSATKMTELRVATRKLASAENALDNASDRLTAATRKLERAEADIAATKAADAKTAEARAAELKAAEAKVAEVGQVAETRAVAAKDAETKLTEAKAAEAKAMEAAAAAATAADATAAQADGANAAEAKPAEAKSVDSTSAEASAAIDQARKAVEEAQKAFREADKAAREAQKVADKAREAADDAREDVEEAQKSAETRAARQQDALAKAAEAKTAAEAAIVDLRKAVDEARAAKDSRQQELDGARRASEEAKAAGRAAAQLLAQANRRLKPLSVFISRKTGRLYVRQDFQSLFDAPIAIKDAERPIGTHLYVSTGVASDGAMLKWSAVTMPFLEPEPKSASRERKRGHSGHDEAAAPAPASVVQPDPETAAGALDRITIPEETSRRLAELAWVGAAVIVSDNGISGETGETTDFIILTRSRASAP
jgi:hypothetical protein